MRLYIHLIVITLLLAGFTNNGCRPDRSGSVESEVVLNQLNRSGMKQGPWEIYSDSILVAKGHYTNGTQEGLWTYYYKNGHMKEEGHYRNGIKEGMWVEWYPDGDIMWKGEWVNGTRNIGKIEADPRITFLGSGGASELLTMDSVYDIQIRIPNIPTSHLFVEVDHGTIASVNHTDHFILHTSEDSSLTLAVGYIPDLQFPDFRNLVQEYQFNLK
jgi:hypothetical protein